MGVNDFVDHRPVVFEVRDGAEQPFGVGLFDRAQLIGLRPIQIKIYRAFEILAPVFFISAFFPDDFVALGFSWSRLHLGVRPAEQKHLCVWALSRNNLRQGEFVLHLLGEAFDLSYCVSAISEVVFPLVDFAGELLDLRLKQVFPRFRTLNFFAFERPLQHVTFSDFFDGLGGIDRIFKIMGLFHHLVEYLRLGRRFSLIQMLFEGLLARRRKKSHRAWLTFGPRSDIEEDLWGILVVVFGILDILDIEE